MTTSPKNNIVSQLFAPPTRLAALLPDGRFFMRSVPVAPDADPAVVSEQVQLALETLSPFPLAHLYHGHFWQPGSARALVYAVYRKRFSAEETAAWNEAQIVFPAFAVLLAAAAAPGTVRVLLSADAITVFHWGDDCPVPSQAVIHPLALEATEAERSAARDQLLRDLGLGESTVEEWAYPELRAVADSGELTFLAGENEVKLSAGFAAPLDIRDREEIDARHNTQRRDIRLWYGSLAAVGLLVLCAVGQVALMVNQSKLKAVQEKIDANKPIVAEIKSTEDTANTIKEAASRHLYPLEMLGYVNAKRPENTTLTTNTSQIDPKTNASVFTATATTNDPLEVEAFKAALLTLPVVQSAEATISRQQAETTTFTVTVTFKPNAVVHETPPKPTAAKA